jgi:hypothetical protein
VALVKEIHPKFNENEDPNKLIFSIPDDFSKYAMEFCEEEKTMK